MYPRPTISAVGRTLGALAPDGHAEFDGLAFQVRAQGGNIDSGQAVVVTGFDPWSLIVRTASMEEVAAQPQSVASTMVTPALPPYPHWSEVVETQSTPSTTATPAGGGLLTVVGGLVFLVGAGLFIGNITGMFPTVPFAGFVVMTIGGAMVGAGNRNSAQG